MLGKDDEILRGLERDGCAGGIDSARGWGCCISRTLFAILLWLPRWRPSLITSLAGY